MKVLLIGTKGFIGQNLLKFLKKKHTVTGVNFDKFLSIDLNKLKSFDVIMNTSISKKYAYGKYSEKHDRDRLICNKIVNLSNKYFIISTRKVYKAGVSLKENSNLFFKNFYEKNKYKTETICAKLIQNRLVILRPSNIIGLKKSSKFAVHKTFLDNFRYFKKKGTIPIVKKSYKDFITIKQFSKIVSKMIEKKDICKGIYNISINKKIFLTELIECLLKHSRTKSKISLINGHSENFTLNNKKLLKLINYTISKKELMHYCLKLGKYL